MVLEVSVLEECDNVLPLLSYQRPLNCFSLVKYYFLKMCIGTLWIWETFTGIHIIFYPSAGYIERPQLIRAKVPIVKFRDKVR